MTQPTALPVLPTTAQAWRLLWRHRLLHLKAIWPPVMFLVAAEFTYHRIFGNGASFGERWQAMANGVFVAPVIRDAPPIQPLVAAIQTAKAEIAKEAVQHKAEVLSFEDHAAQREAARRPQLVAMSDVIVDHSIASEVVDMPAVEAPVHHVSPLDLFDHGGGYVQVLQPPAGPLETGIGHQLRRGRVDLGRIEGQ